MTIFEGLLLGDYTGPAVLAAVALAVITRKLVWIGDLRKVEADRDEWKRIALGALGVAEKMTITGETVASAVQHLPDPGARP